MWPSVMIVVASLQVISGLSVNQALTPSSSPPPADDVIITSKALLHLPIPWFPGATHDGPWLPVPVLPVWRFRWWWRWGKRRRGGGRDGRPRSEPVWWFALLFALLLLAGRQAEVACVEAQAESPGAPGEPQHGAAQCTQWSWKEHPGNQEPTGPAAK